MENLIFFETFPIWGTILFYSVAFLGGYFFMKFLKKSKKNDVGIVIFIVVIASLCVFAGIINGIIVGVVNSVNSGIVIIIFVSIIVSGIANVGIIGSIVIWTGTIIGVNIGWFIGTGVVTGQWLPLLIAILLLSLGTLCGYLQEKIKAKKIVTIE